MITYIGLSLIIIYAVVAILTTCEQYIEQFNHWNEYDHYYEFKRGSIVMACIPVLRWVLLLAVITTLYRDYNDMKDWLGK